MELNILVLPLLGGYCFYTKFNWTAYKAARCSNQRLLFNSAITGLVFFVAARFFEKLVSHLSGNGLQYAHPLGLVGPALAVLTCVALYMFAQKELARAGGADSKRLAVGSAMALVIALYLAFQVGFMPGTIVCNIGQIAALMAIVGVVVSLASFGLIAPTFVPFHGIVFRLSVLGLTGNLIFIICVADASSIAHFWRSFSPYNESGAAALACGFGLAMWWPLNHLLFGYEAAIRRLYLKSKIPAFEREMYESMLEESQIQITLEDGKVYTGWAMSVLPDLSESDTYFKILPVWSGYRDEKKKIIQTTHYDNVYKHYVDQADAGVPTLDIETFTKIIPISRIVLAGKFNDEASGKFIEMPRQDPTVDRTADYEGG